MNFVVTWLIQRGVTSKWAKRLAWAGAGAALLLILGITIAIYLNVRDDRVRSAAIKTEQVKDAEARENSAEDRAYDAIRNVIADDKRVEAIDKADATEQAKPPEQRATLSPQDMALACARLRQNYTREELAEMAAYKEKCR